MFRNLHGHHPLPPLTFNGNGVWTRATRRSTPTRSGRLRARIEAESPRRARIEAESPRRTRVNLGRKIGVVQKVVPHAVGDLEPQIGHNIGSQAPISMDESWTSHWRVVPHAVVAGVRQIGHHANRRRTTGCRAGGRAVGGGIYTKPAPKILLKILWEYLFYQALVIDWLSIRHANGVL